MRKKNFKLVEAIFESGMTHFKLAEQANLSSEARLSRIIGLRVQPTGVEIERLSKALRKEPAELGLFEDLVEMGGCVENDEALNF